MHEVHPQNSLVTVYCLYMMYTFHRNNDSVYCSSFGTQTHLYTENLIYPPHVKQKFKLQPVAEEAGKSWGGGLKFVVLIRYRTNYIASYVY